MARTANITIRMGAANVLIGWTVVITECMFEQM
jgi:hypothetical protein